MCCWTAAMWWQKARQGRTKDKEMCKMSKFTESKIDRAYCPAPLRCFIRCPSWTSAFSPHSPPFGLSDLLYSETHSPVSCECVLGVRFSLNHLRLLLHPSILSLSELAFAITYNYLILWGFFQISQKKRAPFVKCSYKQWIWNYSCPASFLTSSSSRPNIADVLQAQTTGKHTLYDFGLPLFKVILRSSITFMP